MAKTMRYILRLLWLVPLLGLVACGDDFALSTKYYYVKPENKAWLVNDSLVGVPYAMVDNNGITYNFTGVRTSHDFSEGMSTRFSPLPMAILCSSTTAITKMYLCWEMIIHHLAVLALMYQSVFLDCFYLTIEYNQSDVDHDSVVECLQNQ